MAPLLFKDMKGNFSCRSPASLAVCSSVDRRSMVRQTIVTRAIGSSRLKDPQRTKVLPLSPLPKPPSNPKMTRKSSEYRTSTTSRRSVSTRDLISPGNSSRYLLNDTASLDIFPELEPDLVSSAKTEVSAVLTRQSSSKQHHDHNQVVVLRVSLHCKGCEGKVRKHVSKMEGVTSFSIDFETKKVTVMGNVTPLGVLNSVTKVKNAQFWPSPPRCSV